MSSSRLLLLLLLCLLAPARAEILEGPGPFAAIFDRDRGTPRLVLFLSPT